MLWVPGGTFLMGSDEHYPEEAPAHQVTVEGFWMDPTPVTNTMFKRFVMETGYVTFAERPANAADYPGAKPELLVPSSVVFQKPSGRVDSRNHYNWWSYVAGASWRHPSGPGSSIDGVLDHPVVHVAAEDAEAYAAWLGKTLPTEAEWERAARGGLGGTEFAWGAELTPGGAYMANTWQGEFPIHNSNDDGYEATSPVGSYPPNGYGLYDLIGNVWEWTADWYQEHARLEASCCGSDKPRGARREDSYDPSMPEIKIPRRVIKGGSYLCAPNYCRRYRPAARRPQPVDTSTCHVGFRCILRDSSPA
jgi:formylglycine-generating enzyme